MADLLIHLIERIARWARPGGYVDTTLSSLQSYRRAAGGRWYLNEDQSTAWGGRFWSRTHANDSEVEIKTEDWG